MYRTGLYPHLFKKHNYGKSVIGSMEDLDAAKLEEFIAFNDKFYNPNNAVLVVAGDINVTETKKMIQEYFGPIPNKAPKFQRTKIEEEPITEAIKVTEYDSNIQVPMKVLVYRTPDMKDRDTYVLNYISTLLTGGKSSRMYKKMVDEKKMALQVIAFADALEDYGTYIMAALPIGNISLDDLQTEMDTEIERIQNELITEKEYQTIRNKFENQFVNSNSSMEGIANSLANYYLFYGDTNLINKEIEIYRSITREDIQRVARKYLNKNQRLEMDYLKQSTK